MTIQLSVLIWTIITFCLFFLVINRLLLKPMLAFMDQRKERIDRAAEKDVEYKRALAESEQKLAEFRLEVSRHQAQCAKEAVDRAHSEATALAGETAMVRMRMISERKAELGIEHHEIEEILDTRVEELAAAYLSTLVS